VSVRITTYTYPWDVARLGVEPVLDEVGELGIEAVDLAATYHPIDALSPRAHGAASLFTSARGAVHFPARPERYGRIRPAMSAPEVGAVWPELARRASDLGLGLNAWTVVLYQPWIVDAYPDCARVLPSGAAVGSGVCAANEDVREYVVALCGDMVDQFPIGIVRLEGINVASYDYGWLRPRVMVHVPPRARDLLALCFCASCVRGAAAAGLDPERMRAVINDVIAAEVGGSTTPPMADADVAELEALVARHQEASVELARQVVAAVGGGTRVSVVPWSPFASVPGGTPTDFLGALGDVVDQLVMVQGLDADAFRQVRSMVSSDPARPDLSMLLTPSRRQPDLQLELAVELGVEEVGLYNFGLLRPADLGALAASVRRAFA
jgi:hypothetical protein